MQQSDKVVRVALLDMNNGYENQGMGCIRKIVRGYLESHQYNYIVNEFDVRQKNEVPDTSYDIYVSSGGPGSPFDEEGWEWEHKFFKMIEKLYNYNLQAEDGKKKYVFFICHSFQLACRYFMIGNVCKRMSTSFGVFPITKVEEGLTEKLFQQLDNPFYAVDSRDYQVIEPDRWRLEELNASILAIEKERPHVPLERAIMGIRFSPEMIGTQFHPEADAMGMRSHLLKDYIKEKVIAEHGEEKYYSMLEQLEDPDKILFTQSVLLPAFLDQATEDIRKESQLHVSDVK
ncbi:MAG: GMP synthase [Pseudopedobacter saltans]|uniref:GMP synthase n=1 Tax=Pseudopedobacter saltans TaxID=151895 RepID=A0A2W5ENP8_9SPHI|nr:MAG: GMP synthase [Pseudopedobacter saltans]